ncbi:hypothetical protein [Streptomyces sp. NPDC003483]
MRDVRAKKSNRSLRTWMLVSAAGLALVAVGSFAAEAVIAAHTSLARSGTSTAAAPRSIPSASGNQTFTN